MTVPLGRSLRDGNEAHLKGGEYPLQVVAGLRACPAEPGQVLDDDAVDLREELGNPNQRAVPKEDWIVVENAFEPIIDKDTFQKAQVCQCTARCAA